MGNINDPTRPVKLFCCLLKYLGILALSLATVVQAAERKSFRVKADWVVVIDPGHGGHDHGAKGASGLMEKTLTLRLARMIADNLSDRFQSVITRADDYWMDNSMRASVANNHRANFFISLHAGGSFLHQAEGMTIYSYREPNGSAKASAPRAMPTPAADSEAVSWSSNQLPYTAVSALIAKALQHKIDKKHARAKSRVRLAPLNVLAGSGMPAILLEVGYLSNPAEDKKLNDNKYLLSISQMIAAGIEEFFSKNKNQINRLAEKKKAWY